MTTKANTFEGGTDETAITAANSGGSSGNAWDVIAGTLAPVYDTARAAHGTLSGRFTDDATADAGFLWWNDTANTERYSRLYLYKTANPTATFRCHQFANGDVGVTSVDLRTDGKISLFDGTNTARYTSAQALPSNQWVRVEFHVVHNATTGHMEARVFHSMDSSTPTETVGNFTDNWNTGAQSNRIYYGHIAGIASYSTWWDDLAFDTAGWVGPAVTALNLSDSTGHGQAASPIESLSLGLLLSDSAGHGQAGSTTETLSLGLTLTDSVGHAQAGTIVETISLGLTLSDSSGRSQSNSPAETFTLGLTFADSAGHVQTSSPSETIDVAVSGGLTLTDSPSHAQLSSIAEVLSIGLLLSDSTGHVQISSPTDSIQLGLTLSDSVGHGQVSAPTETITFGLLFIDSTGHVQLSSPSETIQVPIPSGISPKWEVGPAESKWEVGIAESKWMVTAL